MSEILPAATVILLRDTAEGLETLLLRRNAQLGFAAGLWVFPGGRVDRHEIEATQSALEAARLAAVRETEEEAQVLIGAEELQYFSHWTTPPPSARRFATWFFLVRAPRDHDVRIDGGEIHEHRWMRPLAALAARERGELEMMPPTFVSLTELSACADADEALARARRRSVPVFEPHFVRLGDNAAISLYFGDAGYAGFDTEAAGVQHRMVMLPGDWHYRNDGIVPW